MYINTMAPENINNIHYARNYIINTYISKTIQNYYKQKNLTFSDRILCSVLYINGSVNDQLRLYPLIAASTSDSSLSSELEIYLDYINNIISKMYKSDIRKTMYTLEYYYEDTGYEIDSYYANYSDAEHIGLKNQSSFIISKNRIRQNISEAEENNTDDDDIGFIEYHYLPEPLYKHYIYKCRHNDVECELDLESFIDKFEGMIHPFRYGDFVKARDGEYGIIIFADENDDSIIAKNEHLKSLNSFNDQDIRIDFMLDSKKPGWNHYKVYDVDVVLEKDVPEQTRQELKYLFDMYEKEGDAWYESFYLTPDER